METNQPIWTKTFISLFCSNLSVFIIFYGLVSTLPLYATGVLKKTDQEAGLLITVFMLSAIAVRPFTGKILDRFGKRKMLWVSLVLYVICTVLYYVMTSFSSLLVLRFLHGVGFSIATTACGALAADTIPMSRRGTGLGYFTMSTNLGIVLGPFIALGLVQTYSFEVLFIVLSLLMVVGAASSLMISAPPVRKTLSSKNKLSLNDFFEKKALPVALLAGLIGLTYSSILSYLSIYAQGKGLLDLTGTFYMVFAAVMLIARPFTGRLFDLKGPSYVMYPGLVCFVIGLIILAYTSGPLSFLVAGGFVGMGYGSLVPSLQTLAIQSTSVERSGYATATFFTFFDSGLALGSYIFGLLAGIFGYQAIYLISTSFLAFVFLMLLLMEKAKRAERIKVPGTRTAQERS